MRFWLRSLSLGLGSLLAVLVPVATAQAPQRPAITGIAFVSFSVSDPAAAKHFYGDELGYVGQPAEQATGSIRYSVRGSGMQYIETVPGPPQSLPAGPNRLLAVGLHTASVLRMKQYLASKGVEPIGPITHGQLTVHDPEGNTIVFVERGVVRLPQSSARGIAHRIIHAGFVVQSAAKEDTFYRDILGFHPYWHGGFKENVTDWSSVQVPEGTDWIEYMLNIPPDASAASRGGSNHVSLGVEHMSDAIAQLKRNGCDTKECTSPQMGRDGKVQLNLYDPDHTRVEVMEFAPSGKTCCSPYTGQMPSAKDPE